MTRRITPSRNPAARHFKESIMIKSIVAALLALLSAAAFAAVDVNKASQGELEAVKGIGPSMSGKILDARKTGPFADWGDLQTRVKGVGRGNAAKFSADGLTVNGTSYSAAKPTPPAATAKDGKAPAAKKTAVPAAK
jgi:competence protein ComEA